MGVEGLDVFRMGAMVFMGLSRLHDLPRGSSQLNRPVTLLLLSRNLSSATALWYMSAVSADVNKTYKWAIRYYRLHESLALTK